MSFGPESTAFTFGTLIVFGLIVLVPALGVWLVRRGPWSRGVAVLAAVWTLAMAGGYWMALAPRREVGALAEQGTRYVQEIAGGEATFGSSGNRSRPCAQDVSGTGGVVGMELPPPGGMPDRGAISGEEFALMEAVALAMEADGWAVDRKEVVDGKYAHVAVIGVKPDQVLSLSLGPGGEILYVVAFLGDCMVEGLRGEGPFVEHFGAN